MALKMFRKLFAISVSVERKNSDDKFTHPLSLALAKLDLEEQQRAEKEKQQDRRKESLPTNHVDKFKKCDLFITFYGIVIM